MDGFSENWTGSHTTAMETVAEATIHELHECMSTEKARLHLLMNDADEGCIC
jgi:hypothetical protein